MDERAERLALDPDAIDWDAPMPETTHRILREAAARMKELERERDEARTRIASLVALHVAYDATTHDMYSNNMECHEDCPRCAARQALLDAVAVLAAQGVVAPPPDAQPRPQEEA